MRIIPPSDACAIDHRVRQLAIDVSDCRRRVYESQLTFGFEAAEQQQAREYMDAAVGLLCVALSDIVALMSDRPPAEVREAIDRLRDAVGRALIND